MKTTKRGGLGSVHFTKHWVGDQVKENGWTRHVACMRDMIGKDHLEDLSVDGRVILK